MAVSFGICIERALAEDWQATSEPDWSQGQKTIGATLSLHYASDKDVATKTLAVTLAQKEGAPYAVAVNGTPLRENSLLAKVLFVIVTQRSRPFTDIRFVSDESIYGGFTPFELRMIGDPELTERASKPTDEHFERRAVEIGPSTREGREMLVSSLLKKAQRAAKAGNYEEALACLDQAQPIPREEDVAIGSGRSWRLEVEELCDEWRVRLVYLPQGNKAKAKEVLERMLEVQKSEAWMPKSANPEGQKRYEELRAYGLTRLQKELNRLGE